MTEKWKGQNNKMKVSSFINLTPTFDDVYTANCLFCIKTLHFKNLIDTKDRLNYPLAYSGVEDSTKENN